MNNQSQSTSSPTKTVVDVNSDLSKKNSLPRQEQPTKQESAGTTHRHTFGKHDKAASESSSSRVGIVDSFSHQFVGA